MLRTTSHITQHATTSNSLPHPLPLGAISAAVFPRQDQLHLRLGPPTAAVAVDVAGNIEWGGDNYDGTSLFDASDLAEGSDTGSYDGSGMAATERSM